MKDGYYKLNYILDNRYASDRFSLIHAYHLIEKDLIKLFDYIDPTDNNLKTYSHRIYELFLRSATEFESNCSAILKSNGFQSPNNFTIFDFFKINKVSRLDESAVKLNIWTPIPKIFEPFKDWKNHGSFVSLNWYQNYNSVKHDRNVNFKHANLENLLLAISGVIVILFSQFYIQTFYPYQEGSSWICDDDGFLYNESSLFSVKEIKSWSPDELYEFDWNKLKLIP